MLWGDVAIRRSLIHKVALYFRSGRRTTSYAARLVDITIFWPSVLLLRYIVGFILFLLYSFEKITERLELPILLSSVWSYRGLSLPASRLLDVATGSVLPIKVERCDGELGSR
jgi:hypothetical protein